MKLVSDLSRSALLAGMMVLGAPGCTPEEEHCDFIARTAEAACQVHNDQEGAKIDCEAIRNGVSARCAAERVLW